MFLLMDILGGIGAAALAFSALIGIAAGLGAVPVARAAAAPPMAAPAPAAGLDRSLTLALARATKLAALGAVTLSVATEPGLAPRVPDAVLDAALDALLAAAIDAAPGGKVLVTARRRGGMVIVAVADDGARFDGPARRAALRATEAAVALQGGRIELAGMDGEGATARLSLPVPLGARQTGRAEAPAAPPAAPGSQSGGRAPARVNSLTGA